MVAAHEGPAPAARESELLRRQLAESDRKLRQHRAALEAGADPVIVAGWMQEEQSRRSELERRLIYSACRRPGPPASIGTLSLRLCATWATWSGFSVTRNRPARRRSTPNSAWS